MKNHYKTIFYGALGKKNKITVGGGETGNAKTLLLLEKNGIEVIKIFKPYPWKTMVGYIIYALRLIGILLRYIFILINNPKAKTVHISGFYLHLIYHEYFLIFFSRLFNRKCIYELRGGGLIEAFQKGSVIYKLFFNAALNNSSIILCQGESYVPFLRSLTKVDVVYYPNYVLNDFISNNRNINRDNDKKVKLIYFGRIVQSKNIKLLIKICDELKSNEFNFDMEIIGSGEPDFINSLKSEIRILNLEEVVKIKEPVPIDVLKEVLITKHFFLFPSNEKREGHSNSLTEAMAMGVVPICSNAGFNREIVGDNYFVVDSYSAIDYANKVMETWRNGNWSDLSSKVTVRIEENYTENVAEKIIFAAYNLRNDLFN